MVEAKGKHLVDEIMLWDAKVWFSRDKAMRGGIFINIWGRSYIRFRIFDMAIVPFVGVEKFMRQLVCVQRVISLDLPEMALATSYLGS